MQIKFGELVKTLLVLENWIVVVTYEMSNVVSVGAVNVLRANSATLLAATTLE